MSNKVFNYKIKINKVTQNNINFDLVGIKEDLILSFDYFTDFVIRLNAFVYIEKKIFTDEEVKALWDLKVNIFDNKNIEEAKPLFSEQTNRLLKLKLLKKEN